MRKNEELLENYYNEQIIFYNTSEIEKEIIKLECELQQIFTYKQIQIFQELKLLYLKKQKLDNLNLVDYILNQKNSSK
ncbi:MAG: hypothetical protein IJ538_04620 [Clostridia bacterium]|nr:hypothetical protein [Clostridia bacterium]